MAALVLAAVLPLDLERVEIVTRPEARRVYTAEEKVRLMAEALQPGKTVQGVSRRHGVCASLLHRWCRAARGEVARQRRPPQFLPMRLVAADLELSALSPMPTASPTPVTPAGAAVPIELVLRNGRVLRLAPEVDTAAVARLAAALEA